MDRAKTRMRAQELSQEDLADTLACTRGAVGHYLSGRRKPSLKQFELIAQALNTDLFWLLYGADGSDIREESASYQAPALQVPVTGRISQGLKRKPMAFISIPVQGSYALLVDNDDYHPRILAGEAVLVSAEQDPQPGDEVAVQYRNNMIMLHSFVNVRNGQYVLDSVVGEKLIRNIKAGEIKFIHKILAVFRPENMVD